MSNPDPFDELRQLYPPLLTTAQVAEMMHCTIGDVRDKVHNRQLKAMRWGQQFRFFREEVFDAMLRVGDEDDTERDQS
jgi:excisionase family DNA binding protein